MVATLTLEERDGVVKCLRPNLKRLMRDTVLLQRVALDWARPLKQHHIRVAALHAHQTCARLADSIGDLHTEDLRVEIFRALDVIYRNPYVIYANRLNHSLPPFSSSRYQRGHRKMLD